MTKICLDCGVVYEDASFCGYCGHPLEDYQSPDSDSVSRSEAIEWSIRTEHQKAIDAAAKQRRDQSWERRLDEILDDLAVENAPTRKS